MYLSIELQSFGLYILATIYRESGSATSAGLKYFLLGGLSSCLILLGTGIIYSVTGLTDLNSIYSIASVLSSMPSALSMNANESIYESYTLTSNLNLGLSLGFIFIIVGFLFKIAAAPFHNWAPSVYDESPTNVTIWLTIMPKIAIFLFLLEIYGNISLALPLEAFNMDLITSSDLSLNTGLSLKNIFLLSSLLSLLIGTVVGLAQIKIKRLFAYSTISHVGFLLLALAINTEQSTESFLFYLIQYTITNLNAFFILLAFGYIINNFIKSNYINSDIQNISELKGQFSSNPILSLSLAICLFSMAGIPPLIGFFGKQSVLLSAIGNGYYFMAIVAIIVSVISASYYLKIIKELQTTNDVIIKPTLSPSTLGNSIAEEINVSYLNLKITNLHAFIISLLTLSILLFVLKPSILLNSVILCTLNYFYL
jgi:NADH-ubiquinone oxidoreductase chain 2